MVGVHQLLRFEWFFPKVDSLCGCEHQYVIFGWYPCLLFRFCSKVVERDVLVIFTVAG
jgi:hypothetical protein